MKEKDPDPVWARQLGLFGVIVTTLIGYTCAGVGLGYWAWIKWGAPFWVLILTTSASLALAMMRVYQLFRKDVQK